MAGTGIGFGTGIDGHALSVLEPERMKLDVPVMLAVCTVGADGRFSRDFCFNHYVLYWPVYF